MISSIETVREARSYGFDVTEVHCQLVSLVNTLELEKQLEEFNEMNDKYQLGHQCY